jgi:hypothetical protein
MTKLDAILKENPGVSLDDLVASRKINNDQKAQALKKPQLQAQVAAFEEQVAIYRKLDTDYQSLISQERELSSSKTAQELERARVQVRAELEEEHKKTFQEKLLTFSRFLAAAANRRSAGDDTSPEAAAFEGALLLVYGGDSNAVRAIDNIVSGSSDIVNGVNGEATGISCKFSSISCARKSR